MGDKRIWSILGNSQRLDGGAMFGNVPKAMWSQWVEPADDNSIPLACRAMLVEDDGRLILFETGVGSFFSPKLRARYGVQEDRHVLLDNLEAAGFSPDDIDIVVLSHLHFDHAGGLLSPLTWYSPKLASSSAGMPGSGPRTPTPGIARRSSRSFRPSSKKAVASRW